MNKLYLRLIVKRFIKSYEILLEKKMITPTEKQILEILKKRIIHQTRFYF